MSAEEELFSLACQDMPVTSAEVRQAMSAWAHELAEKIRADKCGGTSSDAVLCPCGAAAANLIDPEVLNSGG